MNKDYDVSNINHTNLGHMIIVRGMPGSGKSTISKIIGADNHIEADMFFERNGKYNFDIEQLGAAHRWCLNTAQILLNQHKRVIIANTFTTWSEIKAYTHYAQQNGHGITIYTMNTDYGSIHNVPIETMQKMRARFESHKSIVDKINEYQTY